MDDTQEQKQQVGPDWTTSEPHWLCMLADSAKTEPYLHAFIFNDYDRPVKLPATHEERHALMKSTRAELKKLARNGWTHDTKIYVTFSEILGIVSEIRRLRYVFDDRAKTVTVRLRWALLWRACWEPLLERKKLEVAQKKFSMERYELYPIQSKDVVDSIELIGVPEKILAKAPDHISWNRPRYLFFGHIRQLLELDNPTDAEIFMAIKAFEFYKPKTGVWKARATVAKFGGLIGRCHLHAKRSIRRLTTMGLITRMREADRSQEHWVTWNHGAARAVLNPISKIGNGVEVQPVSEFVKIKMLELVWRDKMEALPPAQQGRLVSTSLAQWHQENLKLIVARAEKKIARAEAKKEKSPCTLPSSDVLQEKPSDIGVDSNNDNKEA